MSIRKRPLNGRPVSKPGEPQSKIELMMPSRKLQKLLNSIYDRFQKLDDPKANATAKHDFVFHMTRLARRPAPFDRRL